MELLVYQRVSISVGMDALAEAARMELGLAVTIGFNLCVLSLSWWLKFPQCFLVILC